MTDLRHLLAIYVHAHRAGNSVPPHIDADARAALAAEPAFAASEPSDEDLADLAEVFNGDPLPAMRRALELWGRPTIAALAAEPPAPVPVPVAERPWERPGWCDVEGRCWWSACSSDWKLRRPADVFGGWLLPHWAIPIPQPPQSTTTPTENDGTD